MKAHNTIIVKGKVQGVFYRATAKKMAEELGITGFAQNMPSGNVLIEAEGPEAALQQLIEWCKIGPKNARVSSVETTLGEWVGYSRFEIRR